MFFSFQKTVTMIFPANGTLLIFEGGMYGMILLEAAWILVQNGGPRFHPCDSVQQKVLTPIVMLVQNINDDNLPCLFMCICQHMWHLTSPDLRIAKLFHHCHYTDFTSEWGWSIIHVLIFDCCYVSVLGGACGTYGGRKRCAQGFGVET